ncbi:MAG: hypothetical protein GW941_01365 [Candidatus Pacebacteria bacterium]|nr:hypothetical protein [Candidatus Paceibacterota bacterium]
MAGYIAKGAVVTCSDARIADTVEGWLFARYDLGLVDRIIRPGATAYGESVLLEIVELHGLHHFPELTLAHHTDCGKLPENDRNDHIRQMKAFATRLHERIPEVIVQIALVHTHEEYVEIVETLYDVST